MEIEHLSKHQIILVCLLVSFVSSIATGIVTVSLFDQAPPGVIQTINHVVQTTVEKVTPTQSGGVTTKQTIVVSEDDAVISSIDKASKGIVRILAIGSNGSKTFVGFGVIASQDGYIVTRTYYDPGISYRALLNGGVELYLTLVSSDDTNKLTLFKTENGQGINARTFTPVTFADSSNLKLGQTLIALGGDTEDSVTTGIISSVISNANPLGDTTNQKDINRIRADIYNPNYQSNAVAINLSGEIVGLKVGNDQLDGYVTSNIIKNIIPKN